MQRQPPLHSGSMSYIAISLRRLLMILGSFAVVHAYGATLYVATSGNDSNSGNSSAPLRTIVKAYSLASAGTTIIVKAGTYTDYNSGWGLHLGKSGTSSSPITLQSEVQGGAIIDGQNASDRNVGIYIDGSYNIVDGFEIKNGPKGGITIWANNNQILNCNIHNNGNPASSSTQGQDGVYDDEVVSGNVYRANYIHHNGRTGSNLDHGLYVCGKNELVINNVFLANSAHGVQVAGYTTVANLKICNNVMAMNGGNGIVLWQALSGVDIKNNIFYQNGHYAIGSWDAHGSGINIDHNISYGNAYGNFNFTDGASDYTYSLSSPVYSDPQLMNASSSTFDAHLKSSSPGVMSALNLYSTFTTDMAGALRQSSGAWDLGVYKYGATSSGDTTAPTVSMTAPANGATISGTATITCAAADNVGVASVQFQLDGVNVGSVLTSAPYSISLNTATYANGSHTLRAIASDGAGNQTTSTAVTITISNSTGTVPSLSVVASIPTAVINSNYGAFTFTRTGSTAAALNVNYNLGGTAIKWNDYYRAGVGDMPTTITIPSGSASYTMNIAARDNQTHANPETVVLTLAADPSYQVGSPSSATMTIVSNAPAGGGTSGGGTTNSTSIVLQATKTVGGGIKFTWNSVAGKTYRVASKTDVTSPWKDLSGNITATNSTTTWTDTIKVDATRLFYTVYSIN
jgi:Bacterial Ig domain/Right handed beta helix region